MASSTTPTTTTLLLHCLLVVTLLLSSLPVPSTAQVKGCPFTSMYTFGDGDSSTSDGSTMFNHLAAAFHLPSPKPYASGSSGTESTQGASFATAGATVMSTYFFVERDIQFPRHPLMQSLHTQIENFFATKEDLQRAILFLEQLGANDYKLAFLQGKSIDEASRYVPKVVEGIKNTMRKLINAGATHLFITGVSPMGCLPGYLTLLQNKERMQYDSNNCLRGLDEFSRLHNDHLRQALMELSLVYPRVQIVYGDYYKAFVALLRNSALLGFGKETLTKACCGFGDPYNFRPKETCRNRGVDVCSNPAEYVHWDGFHLTQEASKHVVEAFVAGRGFVYPEFKFPEVMHCTMK
ncbi:hypothetical protein RHMOL_Rhmol05G0106800 [Rhododendron molle]|uniref:Uncharacterized protein n=1 Tax=Rhododendron molle TaxID=49168 RepID=A0ACC0NP41_RHOML|nr:hypothetical protein RHMOL_Rhmol05G0106800 [Rhododendron molle]